MAQNGKKYLEKIDMKKYTDIQENMLPMQVCEPIADYCKATRIQFQQLSLFPENEVIGKTNGNEIKVVELFAGVGGFRIGLERASKRYKTIWNNQWEPSTKRQDASFIYCKRFGSEGHSNVDIATVPTSAIPQHDLLVGGFPCQDYSVATTLKRSGGIEGKKGVLWWQIYRIIAESAKKPKYLFLENVDRLLKSPASATWDILWSGASSMRQNTVCPNAGAGHTFWHIKQVQLLPITLRMRKIGFSMKEQSQPHFQFVPKSMRRQSLLRSVVHWMRFLPILIPIK